MSDLNLPPANLRIIQRGTKEYVFDCLRKQYVRLTPEEWVRQHFVSYLIKHKDYPKGLLVNEACITLGNLNKRCDTVLYDSFLRPQMIIEYKAPFVSIRQEVFDQIVRYNMTLNVDWLIVSNGLQHYCCHIHVDGSYAFLKTIPDYGEIGRIAD
ncbi:MAG: type I restriction enzyme HsdR N-terminal domain-containing protein [Candidatus Azobacteroides sp.]|nr:type I restriction enzyme HsdR N-terminal domain-containing protein [Candidatus Azobacteroides sp.]